MHLVPAPAVRLMKRRVQSTPGAIQEKRFFIRDQCLIASLVRLVLRTGHRLGHRYNVGLSPD